MVVGVSGVVFACMVGVGTWLGYVKFQSAHYETFGSNRFEYINEKWEFWYGSWDKN